MAKQMLIDAYRGKRTAKAPWVPYAGVHCAFLINEPADKMLQDPELLAKGVVEYRQEIQRGRNSASIRSFGRSQFHRL